MNIISNMEEVSGQTVFHTHMSTLSLAIPDQDELAISFTEHEPNFEQLAVLAETIKTVKKGGHMKLKIFLFATGASISYHLVKPQRNQNRG